MVAGLKSLQVLDQRTGLAQAKRRRNVPVATTAPPAATRSKRPASAATAPEAGGGSI